jgi:hypothetical protein
MGNDVVMFDLRGVRQRFHDRTLGVVAYDASRGSASSAGDAVHDRTG